MIFLHETTTTVNSNATVEVKIAVVIGLVILGLIAGFMWINTLD